MNVENIMENMETVIAIGGGTLLSILVLGLMFVNDLGESSGQAVGYITSVEENNGFIFSTDVVYMKSELESSQEDKYCVKDDLVKQKLNSYSKTRENIVITYYNPLIFWRSICAEGVSIIINVEKNKRG